MHQFQMFYLQYSLLFFTYRLSVNAVSILIELPSGVGVTPMPSPAINAGSDPTTVKKSRCWVSNGYSIVTSYIIYWSFPRSPCPILKAVVGVVVHNASDRYGCHCTNFRHSHGLRSEFVTRYFNISNSHCGFSICSVSRASIS